MAPETRGTGRRWLIVIGLFSFLAINFADKALIGLAAEPIMRELHLTHGQFGRIAASFYLFFSLSSLLVGFIADRAGSRWLLFGMAVIWSISQVPLLLYAAPITLIVSRLVLGASEGPAYPVAVHALYQWFFDHERALPSAILTVGSAFGMGFVAPLITKIITTWGWHAAFLALAVAGLVWSALWLAIGKDGPLKQAHAAQGAVSPAASADALPERVPLGVLLFSRTCVGGDLNGFAAYVLLTMATIWLPSYLVRVAGYSLIQVGWIVVLPAFGLMVSSPLLGWYSQRLMARGVSSRHARGTLGAAAVVISGAALVAMPMLPAGPLLIAMVTVAFSVASFAFVSGVLLAGEVVPHAQRGGVLGINVCISTLAGFATPAVMGQIIDHAADPLAGYRLGMMLAGAFAVVAGMAGGCLIHPEADRRRFIARAARKAQGYGAASLASGQR
ncbi:MFS transporter [Paraburkholderia sp. J12]|uniref:MFS transporter n=1 Tax=Paraburkholderia sp. J12 TaxID=2805432 RepID=UPI002ABD8106|nr:MFS transporter [Paraburkholderia sp. J12]